MFARFGKIVFEVYPLFGVCVVEESNVRSTLPFIRLSAIAFVVAFLAFGLSAGTAQAGVAQATGTADVSAAAATTSAAATAAVSASTAAFALCPSGPSTASADVATDSGIVATPEAPSTQNAAATAAATANPNPGFLGVRAEQVDSCGVRIVEVVANSPAAQAQLQADDVIVALDTVASPDISGLRLGIEAHVPGDTITLTIQRSGAQMDVKVTLGVKPADTTATMPAAPDAAATNAASSADAATAQATQ